MQVGGRVGERVIMNRETMAGLTIDRVMVLIVVIIHGS